MKFIKTTIVLALVAMVGACVAVPYDGGYGGGYGYGAGYGPAYYGPPAVVSPSIGFTYYGGGGGYYHHGHGYRGRGRHWR